LILKEIPLPWRAGCRGGGSFFFEKITRFAQTSFFGRKNSPHPAADVISRSREDIFCLLRAKLPLSVHSTNESLPDPWHHLRHLNFVKPTGS